MDPEARRRLSEAVEQARLRAAEAVKDLEGRETAPRSVESALRDAEDALRRLATTLDRDD